MTKQLTFLIISSTPSLKKHYTNFKPLVSGRISLFSLFSVCYSTLLSRRHWRWRHVVINGPINKKWAAKFITSLAVVKQSPHHITYMFFQNVQPSGPIPSTCGVVGRVSLVSAITLVVMS